MLNYPNERKIKVELLKVPDSVEKPGDPVCVWRFTFQDEPESPAQTKRSEHSEQNAQAGIHPREVPIITEEES